MKTLPISTATDVPLRRGPRRRSRSLVRLTLAAALVLPAIGAAGSAGATPSTAPPPPPVLRTYGQQLGVAPDAGAATGVSLGGPHTYWNWPDAPVYTSFAERVTVEPSTTPDAPFFWAYSFTTPRDQGYLGLQSHSYPNTTRIALFSLWAADKAQGANCGPFEEFGAGYTCRLDPYNWIAGREYILRISLSTKDATGQWYRGSVKDTVTGIEQIVGRLHVPTGGTGTFRGWASWTEYFGAVPSTCNAMPRARATFRAPTANSSAVRIVSHVNEIDDGSCRAQTLDLSGRVRQLYPR